MIHQLHIPLQAPEGSEPLRLKVIRAAQIHGLVFRDVLPAVSGEEATWLHEHAPPKPFALAPVTDRDEVLTGLRMTALVERAADLVYAAWQQADGREVTLAGQPLVVGPLRIDTPVSYTTLLQHPPRRSLTLHFLTPTAFKRSTRRLHLPLPANVFARPLAVWQAYAPASLTMPDSLLAWCEEQVYVKHHRMRTITQQVKKRGKFIGFVGRVHYRAVDSDEVNLRLWQALGQFASYCSVGYKTTMGMGAVAWAPPRRRKQTAASDA